MAIIHCAGIFRWKIPPLLLSLVHAEKSVGHFPQQTIAKTLATSLEQHYEN
jgi:hypothetical protein